VTIWLASCRGTRINHRRSDGCSAFCHQTGRQRHCDKYGRTISEIMRASATGNLVATLIYSRAGRIGDSGDPPARCARGRIVSLGARFARESHRRVLRSLGQPRMRACVRARLTVRCSVEPPRGAPSRKRQKRSRTREKSRERIAIADAAGFIIPPPAPLAVHNTLAFLPSR